MKSLYRFKKCPRCGKRDTASIRYGKPAMSAETERLIQQKAIVFGGCSGDKSLSWHCNVCQHRW